MDQLAGMSIITLCHFDYLAIPQAAAEGRIQSLPVDRYEAGLGRVALGRVTLGRVDGFVEMVSRLRHHLSKHRV